MKRDDPVFLADVAGELGYTRGSALGRALERAGFKPFWAKKPHTKPALAIEAGDLAAFRRGSSSIVRLTEGAHG